MVVNAGSRRVTWCQQQQTVPNNCGAFRRLPRRLVLEAKIFTSSERANEWTQRWKFSCGRVIQDEKSMLRHAAFSTHRRGAEIALNGNEYPRCNLAVTSRSVKRENLNQGIVRSGNHEGTWHVCQERHCWGCWGTNGLSLLTAHCSLGREWRVDWLFRNYAAVDRRCHCCGRRKWHEFRSSVIVARGARVLVSDDMTLRRLVAHWATGQRQWPSTRRCYIQPGISTIDGTGHVTSLMIHSNPIRVCSWHDVTQWSNISDPAYKYSIFVKYFFVKSLFCIHGFFKTWPIFLLTH
jgi:hypothetical protein